jgi:hypothetical protein
MTAYSLGCNARLSNGHNHFAQLMFDGSNWVVETQRIYTPEPVSERVQSDDPIEILLRHVRSLSGDGWSIGGGIKSDASGNMIASDVNLNRYVDPWTLNVVCGLLVQQDAAEDPPALLRRECQDRALKAIRDLSQSEPKVPFRAAGASELFWSESLATLESADTAFIAEARYQFPRGHVACRLRGDCCPGPGPAFLGSCREPTQAEKAAIDACLALGLRARTAEYTECLVANGVKVGCEPQDDGSRLCY